MKRWLLLPVLFTFGVFFSSCLDLDDNHAEDERIRIEAYLKISPLQYEKQPSGIYYSKLESGIGGKPINGNFVLFSYVGRLLNGKIFDTNYKDTAVLYEMYYKGRNYAPLYTPLLSPNYPTRRLIPGMEEGLMLMKEGERASFIIPYSLAYGGVSTSGIPAYSPLLFDIKMERVIPDPAAYETEVITNYLASNYPDLNPTSDGIYYVELEAGEGEVAVDNESVSVNYSAYLLNGYCFFTTVKSVAELNGIYSSSTQYEPLEFTVGSPLIIKGLSYTVKSMKKGGKARSIIPSSFAFGENGNSMVTPYTPIILEVEYVKTSDTATK
ncbi:MAG: FKBP-type peptidyl-prolyl cis-trans isomerase [Bacteroidales bacterium]|nr:FKBP-type peptidyl-prolyl cis-trans isomerase [Bacteroidales bacterium]MBN2748100.1 FKBP-type peptidyl-prolyl cis-trans isomerase [Bacteroidales bacterium]